MATDLRKGTLTQDLSKPLQLHLIMFYFISEQDVHRLKTGHLFHRPKARRKLNHNSLPKASAGPIFRPICSMMLSNLIFRHTQVVTFFRLWLWENTLPGSMDYLVESCGVSWIRDCTNSVRGPSSTASNGEKHRSPMETVILQTVKWFPKNARSIRQKSDRGPCSSQPKASGLGNQKKSISSMQLFHIISVVWCGKRQAAVVSTEQISNKQTSRNIVEVHF